MASENLIQINNSVKPYSKVQVAKFLKEIDKEKEVLNSRQKKELDFYLKAYRLELDVLNIEMKPGARLSSNPVAILYSDSLFKLSIKPLLSGILYINDSATVQNRNMGASINGYVGKHLAFYANVTDHWETQVLAKQTYLTQLIGGQYKSAVNRVGGEYSTIRGGTTLSWSWGHIGLIYDRIVWGNGYSGTNILSGRTTPFPQIVFNLKPTNWFEFNYVHGWLDSRILDSTRSFASGTDYLSVYKEKYIAANLFTFIPWNFLQISVGNSIVYSSPKAYPGYLIPFLFYRSVDENNTFIKSNSQLFFTINFKPFRGIHLYNSTFVDEFRLSRITDPKKYNFNSLKFGIRFSDLPLSNFITTVEYTRTNPITYKHRMDVLTFSTNLYSLGNYMRDNSKEYYFSIEWKPISKTRMALSYLDATHYNEYKYLNDSIAVSYPRFKNKIYHNQSLTGSLSYELFAGTTLQGSIMYSNITSVAADGHTAAYYQNMFTPKFLQGKHLTMIGGFSIAF
jgi:hypothetical protein